jgi:hypothetical protein
MLVTGALLLSGAHAYEVGTHARITQEAALRSNMYLADSPSREFFRQWGMEFVLNQSDAFVENPVGDGYQVIATPLSILKDSVSGYCGGRDEPFRTDVFRHRQHDGLFPLQRHLLFHPQDFAFFGVARRASFAGAVSACVRNSSEVCISPRLRKSALCA